MDKPIGTCGACGGPVVYPSHMVDAVPTCKQCGRRPKQAHGPVLDMEGVEHGDIFGITDATWRRDKAKEAGGE